MIAALRQRVADFLRERRIERLCERAKRARHTSLRRVLVQEMCREARERSPAQVARMERARGLA